MRFRAEIRSNGKTATGFEVPQDVVEGLGGGKRPKVTVTINGKTYRSSVAPMGGTYMVGVSAENRALTGAGAGDVVDVVLELDTAPRDVEVPADFAAALDADPAARATFEGLSFSMKRFHVEPIAAAKSEETRRRRIDKSIGILREGRAR